MMHSGRAARHARMHKRHKRDEELNLISLIDIFSVLVFFLLVNFGDMSVLNMNLPASSTDPLPEPDKALKLEVIVRGDGFEVTNDGDVLTRMPMTTAGYDYARLSEYLLRVKGSFQQVNDVRLLLEPAVSYETVVQTMDAIRWIEQTFEGQRRHYQLFPEIALGDAPAAAVPAQ